MRRCGALLLVLAVLGGLGVPAAADARRTEHVWLDESFDAPVATWAARWSGAVASRNVVRPGPGVDGAGIEVVIPKGAHFGSEMRWRFTTNGIEEPDEAWFRYWVRVEADGRPGSGKLPGLTGLYSSSGRGNIPPSDSLPGWSARLQFRGLPGPERVEIGSYVYHLDQEESFGEGLRWSEAIPIGEWACIEGHVAMNTPGQADGVTVGWVNGTEVHRSEDFRFRSSRQVGVAIESFWLSFYHGGDEEAPYEHRFGFDELVVADHRVGCGFDPAWGFNDIPPGAFDDAATRLEALGILDGCEAAGRRFCPVGTFGGPEMAAILRRAEALHGRSATEVEEALRAELGVDPASSAKERVVVALDAVLGFAAPWEQEFDVVAAPGDDLQAMLDAAGPGAAVLVRAGGHLVDSLIPLEGQRLVGQPGATLLATPGARWGILGGAVPGVTLAGVEVVGFEEGGVQAGEGWVLDHVAVTSNGTGIVVVGDADLREIVGWGNDVHVDVRGSAAVRIVGGSLDAVNAAGRMPAEEAWGVLVSAPAIVTVDGLRLSGGHGGGVRVEGGGVLAVDRVVALDLDGPVVASRGARGVAVRNSLLLFNGLGLDEPALRLDAPFVVVTKNTLRGNGGGIVLAPGSPGVLGVVSGNGLVDSSPSGVATLPLTTTALLRWDDNRYQGAASPSFLIGEEEVGVETWLAFGVDGRSRFTDRN
ncbi:MAG: hypothetical protein JSV07_05030 [Acidimicrobiia bacterium]|nr:MAG: hypothetical protein JSV07_05030 [Acidimicrobiia bacterium]